MDSNAPPPPPAIQSRYAQAIAWLQAGRAAEAADELAELAAAVPGSGELWVNLAAAYVESGRPDAAFAAAKRAVECLPNDADAWTNYGLAETLREHWLEAAAAFERAVGCDRDHANAWLHLADCCERVGDLDGALDILDDRFDGWVRRGQPAAEAPFVALMQTAAGRIRLQRRQAVAAKRALSIATTVSPDLAEAHCLLGVALRQLGRPHDAIASYRTAIALDPSFAAAHLNLSHAARQVGKLDVALRAAQRANALAPSEAACNAVSSALRGQGRVEQAVDTMDAGFGPQPPVRLLSNRLSLEQYRDGRTRKGLLATHRRWGQSWERSHGPAEPTHFANAAAKRSTDGRGGRLRIGFLSPDFGRHPVGYFLSGLLPRLRANRIDAYGYCDRGRSDDLARRLRRSFHHWHDCVSLTDAELIRRVRRDRIDILIDLAGHTEGHRLEVFAERAAPVQLSWMGYVGTTGVPNIDGLIADDVHIREGEEADYAEQIVRLPRGYVCYEPPSDLPPIAPRKANRPIFAAYHNPAKVSAETVALWGQILRAVPDSRLRLAYWGFDSPGTKRGFVERFAAERIARERLEFVGPRSHRDQLASYRDIAVQLDPVPYSGGLTTCEALIMGVPVVTRPGETFASRHAARYLTTIGREGWIAADAADYVARAAALATDASRLDHERQTLRGAVASSPLCDYDRFSADFADAMFGLWARRFGTADDDLLAKFCA